MGGRGAAGGRRSRRGFTLLELLVVVAVIAILSTLAWASMSSVMADSKATITRASLQALRDAIRGTEGKPGYLGDMERVPGFSVACMRLHDLLAPSSYPAAAVFDPEAQRGWRGPYASGVGVANTNALRCGGFPAACDRRFASDTTFLQRGFYTNAAASAYGRPGDLAVADAWGNPVVLQIPPASAFDSPVTPAGRFRYARLVSAGADGILQVPDDRLGGMQADGQCPARGDDVVLFLNRADAYDHE